MNTPGNDENDIQLQDLYAKIASSITGSLNERDVLIAIMGEVERYFKPQNWSLFQLDPETKKLYFVIAKGLNLENVKHIRIPFGEGIVGNVAKSREPLCVDDVSKSIYFSTMMDKITGFVTKSIVAVPIVYQGETLGVIELINAHNGDHFSQRELEILMNIADFSAIALSNSNAYRRLLSEIKRREIAELKLSHDATHDVLTGLPNRALLLREISRSIKVADKNNVGFGVMFLDLDNFKYVNDSIGHDAGDYVIKYVSSALQSIIRKDDIIARHGGDEFVIVVNNIKSRDDLTAFSEKILAILNKPIMIQGHEIPITASIGIGMYPKDGGNSDELLRAADHAMYLSKKSGRNQYNYYTEGLGKVHIEYHDHVSALRQAISRNQLVLHYQPQIDMNSKKVIGMEALVRWNHPANGLTYPADFIPAAEESGLVVLMGEWVFRTVCADLKEWDSLGLPPLNVSVNISTRQLQSEGFMEALKGILDEHSISPERIELEFSENIIFNHLELIDAINEIKKIGVKISLDDFGSGYTGLNCLREIPIDRIKIDQSYIHNIDKIERDRKIIQAIMAMGKSMDIDVVAGGVETKSQLDFMREENCHIMQGYYFSRPLSKSDSVKYLQDAANSKMLGLD